MKKIIICIAIMFLFIKCKEDRYVVTEDYVYNSDGFKQGFTVQQIEVKELKDGIPALYKRSDNKVDLLYSLTGDIKKKIWFYKDNGNYYWSYWYGKKHKAMPFRFESGKWYLLWSNEFGVKLNTSRIEFYIYKDSLQKISIHRNTVGKL
jgi:hypothetical protein